MPLFSKTSGDFINLVKNGKTDKLKAVLEGRAWSAKDRKALDINARDKLGYNALHYACVLGRTDIVKMLCDAGADANAPTLKDDITPLLFCAWKNMPQSCMILLDAGATPNAAQMAGTYPLHWAARHGSYEVAKLLLDRGADVNAVNHQGLSALVFAIEGRAIRVMELLVDRGARIDLKHADGTTPVDIAHRYKLEDMLRSFAAAKTAHAPQAQGVRETSEWTRMGHSKIAHVETFPQLSRRITAVFNFESRERVQITQNLRTAAETMSPPVSFDNIAESEIVQALDEFKKRGGLTDTRRVLFRPHRNGTFK